MPLLALLACASGAPQQAREPADGLATSHAECVAAGGEVQSARGGGRCFLYFTPRSDPSAYIRCRDAGGVMRVAGRGMARETTGQSHVCTLIFEPDEEPPAPPR